MLSDSSGKHSFLFLIKETGRLGKEFNVSLNMSQVVDNHLGPPHLGSPA